VKLTAGESDLLPLPTSSPAPREQASQASQPTANIAGNAPAPAPAPALAPVFELASADVKPGTPPETTTPAPIPAPAPASAPLTSQETSTSGRAPAPTAPAPAPSSAPASGPPSVPTPAPTPAPAPSLSPAVETSGAPLAPLPGPGPDVKEAAGTAVQGTSATTVAAPTPAPAPAPTPAPTPVSGETAKTAVSAGGLALGTGLGAALSALKNASGAQEKKKSATSAADTPKGSPASTEKPKAASEPPAVSPPISDSSSSPPSVQALPPVADPASSLQPPPSPASLPVEPVTSPSQDKDATSALPPVAPASPADSLDPHPDNATGPAHQAASKASSETMNPGHAQTHEQTSSQPVGTSTSAESTPREIAQPQPQPSDQAAPTALKPDHQELARQGWAPVKRAGPGMIRDLQREIVDNDDGLGNSDQDKGSPGAADPSAHADKEQSFEAEPAPFGSRKVRRDALTGEAASASMTASASSQSPDKVETVLHKVERNENFWTIARLYYPSGRYYRALWKYNSAKVPVIDELHVNTILKIPPPEDLDPDYIDPPGKRTPRLGAKDPSLAARDDKATGRRASQTEGVPVRRSSRSDPELNLPVSDPFTEQASDRGFSSRGGGRTGGPSRAVNDDDSPDRDNASDNEPEVRSRSTVSRPIYKVRRYDTLRTIARDTLGDSRRADEVLELNRDIIDDPGHLIVGQILELPEDARVVRARSRQ
jgi:hypothetical protein